MSLSQFFIAGLLVGLATPLAGQTVSPTAIVHVAVIDVEKGRSLPDQTVILERGRITKVGPASSIKPPAGALVVDGHGKSLIPGLWDMHVHLSIPGGEELLALYPANGVTGVRDMNDSFPQVRAWRDRIGRGDLVGPRIVAAGAYLVGGAPPLPHFKVLTAAEGRAGVDTLRRLGVDFVKVHNGIPREGYDAIAKRVKELGWTFAGHVPQSITVAEASDAGQRSLEHLTGFTNPCSVADSASLRAPGLVTFLLGPCSTADLSPTIARLAKNGTWITPTLVVLRTSGRDSAMAANDSTNRYRSEGLRQLQMVVMRMPPMSAEALASARFLFTKRQEVVRLLAEGKVPILAGSDAPTPGTFPGFALHDELQLMVGAGLTPAMALRTATLEPARYLRADSLGTIAVGKVADLVLLDADPLTDITNTRRIAAVWQGGRMIDGKRRAAILTAAEAAARR